MDPFPEEYLVAPGEEPSAFSLGGDLDDPFAADWRAGEHQIERRTSIDSGPGWGMNMHGINTPLRRNSVDSRGVDGVLGGTAPGSLGSTATGFYGDMRRVGSDPLAPDPQPTASPKHHDPQEFHEQRQGLRISPGAVLEGLQIHSPESPGIDGDPGMQQRHGHAQAELAVEQERANTHHPSAGISQGQQLPTASGLTYAQQVATQHRAPNLCADA